MRNLKHEEPVLIKISNLWCYRCSHQPHSKTILRIMVSITVVCVVTDHNIEVKFRSVGTQTEEMEFYKEEQAA